MATQADTDVKHESRDGFFRADDDLDEGRKASLKCDRPPERSIVGAYRNPDN